MAKSKKDELTVVQSEPVLDAFHILDRDADEKAGFAWTMFHALMDQIEEFEATLTERQEVGALLANFGTTLTIVISEINYRHPHLIIFRGFTPDGSEVELCQHVSQVNILLKTVEVTEDRPARRVGFELPDENAG